MHDGREGIYTELMTSLEEVLYGEFSWPDALLGGSAVMTIELK